MPVRLESDRNDEMALLKSLSAGGWNGREVLGRTESSGREAACNLAANPLRLASRDKCDDAAAEAASGHPCAEGPGGAGRLDGEVNLRHGDLEVVAHGLVRCVQQRRQVDDPARPQARRLPPAPWRFR